MCICLHGLMSACGILCSFAYGFACVFTTHSLLHQPHSHVCLHVPMQVGPYVCVLKTHVDVFDTWSPVYAEKLAALAEKHGESLRVCCGWVGVCNVVCVHNVVCVCVMHTPSKHNTNTQVGGMCIFLVVMPPRSRVTLRLPPGVLGSNDDTADKSGVLLLLSSLSLSMPLLGLPVNLPCSPPVGAYTLCLFVYTRAQRIHVYIQMVYTLQACMCVSSVVVECCTHAAHTPNTLVCIHPQNTYPTQNHTHTHTQTF